MRTAFILAWRDPDMTYLELSKSSNQSLLCVGYGSFAGHRRLVFHLLLGAGLFRMLFQFGFLPRYWLLFTIILITLHLSNLRNCQRVSAFSFYSFDDDLYWFHLLSMWIQWISSVCVFVQSTRRRWPNSFEIAHQVLHMRLNACYHCKMEIFMIDWPCNNSIEQFASAFTFALHFTMDCLRDQDMTLLRSSNLTFYTSVNFLCYRNISHPSLQLPPIAFWNLDHSDQTLFIVAATLFLLVLAAKAQLFTRCKDRKSAQNRDVSLRPPRASVGILEVLNNY